MERRSSFAEAAEDKSEKTESDIDVDLELRAKKYWHEFGFPGEAPAPGTLVMKRLLENCQQYERYISNPRLLGATGWEGGRRQFHEKLAGMIFGRNLQSLGDDVRERVTEFACLVATGLDSHQLGDLATYQNIEE
ncbi:MAG: hypothetical protein AAB779_02025 [Patescibacteria group bacterium]